MSSILPFLRRLLRMIYQYIYVILILQLAYGLFRQPLVGIKWLLYILGILTISYIFRDICSRGIVLFLIHAATGVATYFVVGSVVLRWIIIAITLEFFMDAMLYMHSNYTLKRMFDTPWMSLALGVATTALGAYFGVRTLVIIGYTLPIATILIFLVSLYLEGLEEYLHRTKHVSGAPMGQIISVNSIIVSGIMGIILIVIAMGSLLHLDIALAGFVTAVLRIIKIIFLIIVAVLGFIFSILSGGMGFSGGGLPEIEEMADEPGLLASVLQFIIIMLFMAFMVYMLIRLIRWIVRIMIARQDRTYEMVEDISGREKTLFTRESVVREDRLRGGSPVIRARRIYRSRILRLRASFVPDRTDTTGDISGLVELYGNGDMNIHDLTSIYNDVRYGDRVPTAEELRRMKKM